MWELRAEWRGPVAVHWLQLVYVCLRLLHIPAAWFMTLLRNEVLYMYPVTSTLLFAYFYTIPSYFLCLLSTSFFPFSISFISFFDSSFLFPFFLIAFVCYYFSFCLLLFFCFIFFLIYSSIIINYLSVYTLIFKLCFYFSLSAFIFFSFSHFSIFISFSLFLSTIAFLYLHYFSSFILSLFYARIPLKVRDFFSEGRLWGCWRHVYSISTVSLFNLKRRCWFSPIIS